MNNQIDEFKGRVLTTMALCKDISQNVLELCQLELCQETNDILLSMRQEAAIQAAELSMAFAEMTQLIDSMANPRNSASASHSSIASFPSDNMSVQSFHTAKHGTSPQKRMEGNSTIRPSVTQS